MSSFVHRALIAGDNGRSLGRTSRARNCCRASACRLPPVNLPTRDLPVAGPALDNILAQPGAREAVAPTLNSVCRPSTTRRRVPAGDFARTSPAAAARADPPKSARAREPTVRPAGPPRRARRHSIPIRPPCSSRTRAGFAIMSDDQRRRARHPQRHAGDPARTFDPRRLRRLRSVAPRLQADFDHVFEPAGGELLPFAGTLAASQGSSGSSGSASSMAALHRIRRWRTPRSSRTASPAARSRRHGTAVAS